MPRACLAQGERRLAGYILREDGLKSLPVSPRHVSLAARDVRRGQYGPLR